MSSSSPLYNMPSSSSSSIPALPDFSASFQNLGVPQKRGRGNGPALTATIQTSALSALNPAEQKSDGSEFRDLLSRLFSNQSTLASMHKESCQESPVFQGLIFQALLKFQDSLSPPQRIHVDKDDVTALRELKKILEETETPFYKYSLEKVITTAIAATKQRLKSNKKQKLDGPLSAPISLSASPTPSPSLSPGSIATSHTQTQPLIQNFTSIPEASEKAYSEVKDYLRKNSEKAKRQDYFERRLNIYPKPYLKHFATDVIHYSLLQKSGTLLNTNPRYYLLKYFSDPKSVQLASLKEASQFDLEKCQNMLVEADQLKNSHNLFLRTHNPEFISKSIAIPKYRHTWPHFDPNTPPQCELVGINPIHAINFATIKYIIYQISKELLEQVKKDHPDIYIKIIEEHGMERTLFFLNITFELLKKAEYHTDEYLALSTDVPSTYDIALSKGEKLVRKTTLINHDSFEVATAYNFRMAPNEPYWAKKYLDTLTSEQHNALSLQLRTYRINEGYWDGSPMITLLSQIAKGIEARYFFDINQDPNTKPGPLQALLAGVDPAVIEKKFSLTLNLNPWAHVFRKRLGH